MAVYRSSSEKLQGTVQTDGLYLWTRRGTLTAWDSMAVRRGFRLASSAPDRIVYERTTNFSSRLPTVTGDSTRRYALTIHLTPARKIARVEFARSGVILNTWPYVSLPTAPLPPTEAFKGG